MGDHRLEGAIEVSIREALGSPAGCNIRPHNNTYFIEPKVGQKEVQINAFHDTIDINGNTFYLLRICDIVFDHCVFACEIKVKDELNISIHFKNCIFQRTISFLYATFNNDVVFRHAIFEDVAYFESNFNSRTDFIRCKFKSKTYFINSTFSEYVDMHNSTFQYAGMKQVKFKKGANFLNCNFQNEADFSDSTFSQKADFTQTIFKTSAYFDKATFEGDATFERSEFCENAHFYQARFNRDPNFFQATFNEYLNLTGTTIFNFNFEQIKFLIEQENEKIKKADEYRDVFKNIKNALIKSGNLLGASRFRKMELYCKEIELDLKKKENRETSTQDFVDRIQLYCYRVTSDHHTDLILILNNVIFLIALFGITNLVLVLCTTNCTIKDLIEQAINIQILGTFVVSTVFISIVLCFMLDCCKDLNPISYIEQTSMFLFEFYEKKIPNFLLFILFILLCIAVSHIECPIYFMLLQFFILFIPLYICSDYIYHELTRLKYYFVFIINKILNLKRTLVISYFIVALMLVFKPSLILPVLGKVLENKTTECCYVDDFDIFEYCLNTTSFPYETLNLIYMLFLFLLLWSLQKTARKNTIVPN